MTRWQRLLTLTLLISFSALLLAAPSAGAATPSLRTRLAGATLRLQDLRHQLALARAGVLTAQSSGDQVAEQQYRAQISRLMPPIRSLVRQIRRLQWALAYPMQPAANGSWLPVLRAAATRYHLSVTGLHRLMSLESGGRARAVGGGGLYLGLFQYCRSTWRGVWNPFRNYSILNGGAQIWATAYAIHQGWARQMWPNTYPMAFGAAAR